MRNSRVLAVDDDAVILETIRGLLESQGLRVTTRTNALEGFRQILDAGEKDLPFDLLITDLDMPGERGTVLIRAVRDLEDQEGVAEAERLPILLLTSYEPEDIPALEGEDLMELGVGYLDKSRLVEELVRMAKRMQRRDRPKTREVSPRISACG